MDRAKRSAITILKGNFRIVLQIFCLHRYYRVEKECIRYNAISVIV